MGNGGVPIVIPPFDQIDIGTDGTISIQPQGEDAVELLVIDRIKLVTLDPATSFKGLDGLMHVDANAVQPPDLNLKIRSGYVETSNVNAVHEMTSIITESRQFEMNIRMMKTAEEVSSAATSILSLN